METSSLMEDPDEPETFLCHLNQRFIQTHYKHSKCTNVFRIPTCLVVLSTIFASIVSGQPGQPEQYNLNLFISEDADVGTKVGVISGTKFKPPYARWISRMSDSKTFTCFLVDLDTGWIITKGDLDREEQDHHTIIISTSFTSPKLVIVSIQILDVNDNAPAYMNPFVSTNVPESAPKDHRVPLGSVRDEDLADNTTQKVDILSGNEDNDFVLQVRSRSSTDKTIDLVVRDQLDYERKSFYNILIRATDGGGRYSDMRAQINILDQNDNEPIFNTSKYSATLAENVTIGTLVLQVHATDIDSGENSRITYKIQRESNPGEYFAVNETTGWVRVNKPLDYESRDRFSLTLEASDHGVHPQIGKAALEIIVENVSEQLGGIRIEFLPLFVGGHVMEDTPVGTEIATIHVEGADTAVSLDFDVSLYRSDGYFQVKSDGRLSLCVSSQLDREQVSNFEMILHVEDGANPPLRASRIIKVVVGDVNDNSPVFANSAYSVFVEETAQVGAQVLIVSATDYDAGKNAEITYRMEDGSQSMQWFSVDSKTGVITTKARLDCDINPQSIVTIVATDGGSPPRMGSVRVTISVKDSRARDPEFDTSFYSIKVAENRRVGDCIVTVSAKDPECGRNSPVTYRIANSPNPPKEFRVDALSGALCIQSVLDYETANSYHLLVEAVNKDGRSAQAVVQVEITDINDNHPRFEPKEYSINVLASSQPGQLLTVQARDRDSWRFGTVSYTITDGNDKGYYGIDSHTGAIFLKKHLPKMDSTFTLRVLATDGGGLTSHDFAKVKVTVISREQHPLVFTPAIFNFTVSEDAGIGHMVGQVKASLSDPDRHLEITYSEQFQTADWFFIDKRTGCIYTSSKLDRELHPFVIINIEAQSGFPPASALAQANITILDVNDNVPYFPVPAMLEIELWENTKEGAVIYVARAHDRDFGNNGTIRYRLFEDPGGTFTINDQSGEVILVKELDFEQQREYQLTVSAEDLGTPARLSSKMSLIIKIKDVNDNKPLFDRAEYVFYLPENVNVGHQIGRVLAYDGDSGHNRLLSFSLRNNSYDSLFEISPLEGIVWTLDTLDREQQEMYELTVEAADHGSPVQLTATALIRIIIIDINDHGPVFSRQLYKFNVLENQDSDSLVGWVFAQDLDSGDSGHIHFFFCEPQIIFSLNQENGEIRTRVSLDREMFPQHNVTVCASDNGHPHKTAVANVQIRVQDDNDNAPVFQGDNPLLLNVSENRQKGTEVGVLVAFDLDEGDNALMNYFFDKDLSESSALAHFEIHWKSGRVTTKEVLDYETQNIYHLTVTARDCSNIFLQTSLTLIISVLDENDHAFHNPANHLIFECVENISVGTAVGQVRMHDEQDPSDVTFFLVGGNVFSLFSVDSGSGVISVLGDIDYEKSSSHFLSIQLMDGSSSIQRNIISVAISVSYRT